MILLALRRQGTAPGSFSTFCSNGAAHMVGSNKHITHVKPHSHYASRHMHTLGRVSECGPHNLTLSPRSLMVWRRRQSSKARTAAASNRTEYEDPAFTWAKKNPLLAQDCLEQPPLLVSDLVEQQLLTNSLSPEQQGWPSNALERYCQSRHWNFPVSDEQQPLAMALVSHVLSAPLTMAQFHIGILDKKLHQTGDGTDNDQESNLISNNTRPFRWCCIGARAESTLPMDFWKEYLWLVEHYYYSRSNHRTFQGQKYRQPLNIQLDFVGPDIVIPPARPVANVSWNESSLEICWRHEGLFHDIVSSTQQEDALEIKVDDSSNKLDGPRKNLKYDAFLLLNPGLGHDNLIDDWKPTIELLLRLQQEQQRRDRPVICLSAHSKLDAQRDIQILKDMYNVDLCSVHGRSAADDSSGADCHPYQLNPFSSRITYRDPILVAKTRNDQAGVEHGDHFVRPNHYVATIW